MQIFLMFLVCGLKTLHISYLFFCFVQPYSGTIQLVYIYLNYCSTPDRPCFFFWEILDTFLLRYILLVLFILWCLNVLSDKLTAPNS